MSPALLDTAGVQSQVLEPHTTSLFDEGQVSRPLNSSTFVDNDRVFSFDAMSNQSNDINPDFQFTAPSISNRDAFGTIQGISRSRIAKVRKPQQNRTMGGGSAAAARKFDAGYHRFQPGSNDFGRVSSVDLDPNQGGKVESSILDDIRKLRLGDEKASIDANGGVKSVNDRESGIWTNSHKDPQVDVSSTCMLSDEIKRLNIEGSTQHETSISSEGKHSNLYGDGDGYTSLLATDLKKINIKDPGVTNGNGLAFGASRVYNFEFDNRKNESDFVASGTTDSITNRMKNLDVKAGSGNDKEKVTKTCEEKATFGLSSNSKIADDIGKLKIGDESKGSHYHAGGGKSSSQTTGGVPEDVNFHGRGSIGVEVQIPKYQANDGAQTRNQFVFTCKQDSTGMPCAEIDTPNPKATLFTGFHQKVEFGVRRESIKENLTRQVKVEPREAKNFRYKQEPSGSYSPMEVSPYQETERDNQSLRDTCTTSEDSVQLDENNTSDYSQQSYRDIGDEDLIFATKHLGISEGKSMTFEERKEQLSSCCGSEGASVKASSEESVSAVKTESFKSVNNFFEMSGQHEEVSSRLNAQPQSSTSENQFFSASSSESSGAIPFKFSASSSFKGQTATAICSPKKKKRTKGVQDPYNYLKNTLLSNASSTIHFSSSPKASAVRNVGIQQNVDLPSHHCKERINLEVDKRRHVKQDIASPSATAYAAKEACEKWRLRGNQAYSSGDLDKAEDCYTQGINCISKSEASRDELRALMLCYSNRAAVRMSLARYRDALMDCGAAAEIDPKFFRVQVRKANCYIALGEVAEALPILMKLLQSGTEVCADRKLIVEASESFQKAQKVCQCIDHSAELLQRKTSKDAELSLQAIDEALAISPYSEKLLQMKAEAFLMMRKYQEVIQLCEQTLRTADKNFPLLGACSESINRDSSEFFNKHSSSIWRYSFTFNSYFYLGMLEEGLDFLEKQTDLKSATERYGPQVVESLIPLLVPARELVKHKSAGTAAYQAGKHAQAIEHYTAALTSSAQSLPFAVVCFGNRAAAYQALGQIADAIADCNLAIAIDRNYLKAISRRATLYEMIRDYDEAASDLQRVISLLTKQAEENANQPGTPDRSVNPQADLRQAYTRLAHLEEQAIKEPPLDFYYILGVEPSATSADLKKAYRKAALRHHPDKACQLLTRGENIDDGIWKEMTEEVQREAARLFKMIAEAYSVLSDPTKRFRYEEEVRNALKKPSGMGTSRMRSDGHSYPYNRSNSWRTSREAPTSTNNPHNRQFESSRSSRFY